MIIKEKKATGKIEEKWHCSNDDKSKSKKENVKPYIKKLTVTFQFHSWLEEYTEKCKNQMLIIELNGLPVRQQNKSKR